MKNSIINFRVDELTKNKLDLLCETGNINISVIIRNAINHFIDNEIILNSELSKTKQGLHLIKTIGFSEFIFWLYDKSYNSEICEENELYIQFIELIREFNNYPIFNSELLEEFNKVSSELSKIVNDPNYQSVKFNFADLNENSFDYNVLADFIYTLRYDDENNKVIHCK